MSKRPVLVAYDYGKGGIRAFLLAESEVDIQRRFPELQIIHERHSWLDADEETRLRNRMTIDIDDTEHAFLAAVLQDRQRE